MDHEFWSCFFHFDAIASVAPGAPKLDVLPSWISDLRQKPFQALEPFHGLKQKKNENDRNQKLTKMSQSPQSIIKASGDHAKLWRVVKIKWLNRIMCILQRTSIELVEPVIAIQLRPRAQHPFRSYSTIHLLKPEKCHEDAVFHLLKDHKYVTYWYRYIVSKAAWPNHQEIIRTVWDLKDLKMSSFIKKELDPSAVVWCRWAFTSVRVRRGLRGSASPRNPVWIQCQAPNGIEVQLIHHLHMGQLAAQKDAIGCPHPTAPEGTPPRSCPGASPNVQMSLLFSIDILEMTSCIMLHPVTEYIMCCTEWKFTI